MKLKFVILILFLIIVACKQAQKVADVISKPTAKEIFERSFKDNDSLFNHYEMVYQLAKKNELELALPAVVQSQSDSLHFTVLGYTLNLQLGERFNIEANKSADSLQLVLDIYEFENDSVISKTPITSNKPNSNKISFNANKTGAYKIVLLIDKNRNKNVAFKLFTSPTLVFPVSGKDNKAVQSFWGASRGGGSRSHEGIDIFAKRGTPVVAATNGFIYNTGERGLGGKQVWLREGLFGQSLYYAHLDSIAVTGGTKVNVGDTLGFVGNTGNAKTTNPHLHFGIYSRGGAVDPYPFVKQTESIIIEHDVLFGLGATRLQKNELRVAPDVKSKKLQDLKINTPVKILSKTKRWYHLRVHDSLQGFMHESLIREID